jgi:hypothetical protein
MAASQVSASVGLTGGRLRTSAASHMPDAWLKPGIFLGALTPLPQSYFER